jgi:transcriptional repressor NrdR
MLCPYCGNKNDKVVDSRASQNGLLIRRRRECLKCKKRFTTYERPEQISLMVVKKDGRREIFDREKILSGIIRACEKRPIGMETIREIVDNIEKILHNKAGKEVFSKEIGEQVITSLYDLDEVAYVRFASVYRQFKDVKDFRQELDGLLK